MMRAGSMFSDQLRASNGRGPAMTLSSISRSAAVRAIGPGTTRSGGVSVPGGPGMWPRMEIRFCVALWPKTPQKWAGVRIDPARSLPTSSGISPAASAAAAPPDEPPGVCSGLYGLFVVPKTRL